jgi:hypothetical protein
MDFTSQLFYTHEIIKEFRKEAHWFLAYGTLIHKSRLQLVLAGGRRWPWRLAGVFSPAVRVWPEMNWSHMIYMSYCVHGWVMCTTSNGGAMPAMRDGGGRGGAEGGVQRWGGSSSHRW